MGLEDWDLFAIVRSCKGANNNTAETPPNSNTGNPEDTSNSMSCLATFTAEDGPFSFPNLVQPNGFQELHQLLMTFNPTTTATTSTSGRGINPNSPPFPDFAAGSSGQHHHPQVLAPTTNYTSIGASTSGSDRFYHHQQQQQPQIQTHVQQPPPLEQEQQKQHNQLQVQVPQTSSMALPNTKSSQTPRSRKRKSQQKKTVCHVTPDNLSADLWAWRKYGQKPIKGSPYPRNYYRCSSCKGCLARKQVERSLSDPGIFVVTYTGEHKHAKPAHRNSLAGSTRNKPCTTRLPETQETAPAPSHPDETQNSFKTDHLQTQKAELEDVAARESGGGNKTEQELGSSEEEDDDVLIPNSTAAMSEAVFLGHSTTTTTFNGDVQDEKITPGLKKGSDLCSEPVSDDNQFSPG